MDDVLVRLFDQPHEGLSKIAGFIEDPRMREELALRLNIIEDELQKFAASGYRIDLKNLDSDMWAALFEAADRVLEKEAAEVKQPEAIFIDPLFEAGYRHGRTETLANLKVKALKYGLLGGGLGAAALLGWKKYLQTKKKADEAENLKTKLQRAALKKIELPGPGG